MQAVRAIQEIRGPWTFHILGEKNIPDIADNALSFLKTIE